jgi:type II secretory pathway component GspD/PulD (secretin)
MVINVTESQPDFSKPVDGTPSIIDNTAATTVLLGNGETTVIGGLFQMNKSKSVRGVPGLQRIPLLGALFSSTRKQRTKKELMIFITPTIMDRGLATLPEHEEQREQVQFLKREKPKRVDRNTQNDHQNQ